MPTIVVLGPYRFYFYAGDWDEPPHIHVEREDLLASGSRRCAISGVKASIVPN